MKRILSIMGGGIRGIIPCCALAELEQQTGKLTREHFDFVGGTSTGSLLTATVLAGIPAEKSLSVYLNDGKRIFSPTSKLERHLELVAKGRMFDAAVLHQVVQLTLGQPFYDWTMNDCPIPGLITATGVGGNSLYFTQDRPTNAKTTGKVPLVDAAVASACATTYHDMWKVPGVGWCADGGCSANADPVYQTCVEAFTGYKCYGSIDPNDATVVSLGTGFYLSPNPKVPASLLDRIAWVTSALVNSSKTIAAESVERHWPGVLQVINPLIPSDIDEADVDAIPLLLKVGREAAAKIDWINGGVK